MMFYNLVKKYFKFSFKKAMTIDLVTLKIGKIILL